MTDESYRGRPEIPEKPSLLIWKEKENEANSGILVEKVKKNSFLSKNTYLEPGNGPRYPAVSTSEFMRMHVIVPIVRLMDHSGSTNDESFEALVRRSSTHDLPLL